MDPIDLVVEDTFRIRGRGVFVRPALDADRYRTPAVLTVELVDPDGSAREVRGQLVIEHLQLIGGGRKWQTVVVLDEDVDAVVVGTRLRAHVVSS